MTENTHKAAENIVVEETPKSVKAADDSRASLANEAIAEGMKSARAGATDSNSGGMGRGGGGSGQAIDAVRGAAGGAKDSLPNVTLDGADQAGKMAGGVAGELAKSAETVGRAAGQLAKSGESVGRAAGELAKGGEMGQRMQSNESIKDLQNHLKADDLTNKSDKLSDMLKDGKISHEDFGNKLKDLLNPKDGVEKLPTGDYLVREDGKQTLFTPNGDRVTVNPDGTSSIKGDVKSVKTGKDGTTTVEFGDGAKVSFDKEGLLSVNRNGQGVAFGRLHGFPGGENKPVPNPFPGGLEPKPWPETKPGNGPMIWDDIKNHPSIYDK